MRELLAGNVEGCLCILRNYDLLKEDIEIIAELVVDGVQILKRADTKTKAAVTRAYNKMRRVLPYSVSEAARDKKDEDDASEEVQESVVI
eukprot:jgi/Antlo1/266/1846